MYGPVNKRHVPGKRGDAVALLAELVAAEKKASHTYDLNLKEFVPADFWSRVAVVLEEEQHNIKEIK